MKTCSLIYQFAYKENKTEKKISETLELIAAGPNCTIEPYLIDTYDQSFKTRFGGISYADNIITNNLYENQSSAIIWFQNQAFHSMTAFLHEFYSKFTQCIYNSYDGKQCNIINSANQKPLYKIYNHPISLNDQRISYDSILQKVADIGVSLTILCAYSFIPAGFVVFIVKERITQEKRLQYVCGVKPVLYWLSSFIWDFLNYLVIMGITLAVISAFGVTAYTANARNLGSLIVLLICFGFSCLPMTYMLSRFLNDAGSAYMIVFCFTLFSGIATCVAVFLLSFVSESNPSVAPTYRTLEKISLVFPSFSLGSGLIELTKNQILTDTFQLFGITNIYKDPYSFDMLGQKYLALILTGLFFFGVIVIMELQINFFACCEPDMDVKIYLK